MKPAAAWLCKEQPSPVTAPAVPAAEKAHMKPAAAWLRSEPPPRRARKSIWQASSTSSFST